MHAPVAKSARGLVHGLHGTGLVTVALLLTTPALVAAQSPWGVKRNVRSRRTGLSHSTGRLVMRILPFPYDQFGAMAGVA